MTDHPLRVPAWLVLAALASLCITPLITLAVFGGSSLTIQDAAQLLTDPVIQRALRFTLLQAALSTFLSIAFAIPVLMAIRQMPGRHVIRAVRVLFSLPLVLPQIVATLAIVAVFGQNGWIAGVLDASGISWPSIYGLTGILIAHVFFNMPLAVRVFDHALQSLPPEYAKNAAQLGMSRWRRFVVIEWTAIRDVLGGLATLIFLLCATSFTVVLVLGGGPRSTTLEVAIYQALAFDFDPGRAVMLILLQVVVTGGVALAFMTRSKRDVGATGYSIGADVRLGDTMAGKQQVGPLLSVLALTGTMFVGLPFISVFLDGLSVNPLAVWLRPDVLNALATSIVVGLLSASLAVTASALLVTGSIGSSFFAMMPTLALVFPPIVLSAGWFLTIRQFADPFSLAGILIVIINAAMALPFVLRILDQAFRAHTSRYQALEDQLALTGWLRWRRSILPALRAPLLVGFAFAFALSLGDFGVVALFGSERLQTLPYLIYASFGSYRTNDAASLALLLTLLVFLSLSFAEWFGSRPTRTERSR